MKRGGRIPYRQRLFLYASVLGRPTRDRGYKRNPDITFALSDDAKDWLAERGYDPAFGARPLKRVMKRHVSNGLSEALLEGFVDDGDTVRIELASDDSGLTFERVLPETGEPADAGGPGGDGAATVDV